METPPDTCNHEWSWEAGDPETGMEAGYICELCGAVDINKAPPTLDDDIV